MLPKTIILHYKRLKSRKQSVIQQLNQYNFTDYTFYENYDQNELTGELINKLYQPKQSNPNKWNQKVSLWGNKGLRHHKPILTIAEISVTIKFGMVFKELLSHNFDYCIIFEDDVILCEDFENLFFSNLSQTPDHWDAIYFNDFPSLTKQIPNINKYYLKPNPSSRGGASTLLRYKTVEDLSSTWFPFNLVSDWELSAQHFLHNHKVYWWNPPLTYQGSIIGRFKSTLR